LGKFAWKINAGSVSLNQRLYRNPFTRQSSGGKNVDWMEKVSDDQYRQG
jgi:hypothetical protein